MLDNWGYAELIIHPAPLNIFTLGLLPCVIRKSLMRKASDVFSKSIFWLENVFYIFFFFMYEMILCPYIYIKVLFNIMVMTSFLQFFPLVLFWLVTGPFILFYALGKDMFYFVKILCDY